MKWTNRLGKWLVVGGAWSTTALVLGAAGVGCLARDVGTQPPTTKVNFTSTVSQQAVDKVDLLFAIDNSASMGDKQAILADAVPDLINGLLKPRCANAQGAYEPSGRVADPQGNKENRFGCPDGYEPEFKPVSDMHIGVVSSSLGNFGGDVCTVGPSTPRTDDRGHLLNIKKGGGDVALAKPGNFLAWFPDNTENKDTTRHPSPATPVRSIDDLASSFKELVTGVDQTGCGLEAQLESVYRFLVQPDPWDTIVVDQFQQADLGDGVDLTVIQQRADFLRPDSLVAIVMLTDEEDSSADPLAIGGQGYAFMSKNFPGSTVLRGGNQGTTAPRGTTACATNPGSEDCQTCAFKNAKTNNDPNCQENGGFYAAGDDDLNVRFHRMKERYGIDPQYPITRYVDGFTKTKVPNRAAEHVTTGGGGARRTIAGYTSTGSCTNPLFASKLPRTATTKEELCNLAPGTRSPDLVFFAVVGGVPNELLYKDPKNYNPDDPDNAITNDKWNAILGRSPETYDYDGIDPHMVQSVAPRTALGLGGADQPRGTNGNDPINGREWNTAKGDLQYACTFDLPQPRTCADNDPSCDCTAQSATNPPLCGSGNQQIKAKAYPTTREFQVVRKLGDQGVIASLCPIQLSDTTKATYGYRPAVAAIVSRLKNALTTQCLPQKLRQPSATDLSVPCLVLAQLSEVGEKCSKYADYGLKDADPAIVKIFRENQKAESGNVGDGGLDLAALTVCEVPQETVARGASCKDSANMSWCYVENDIASGQAPAGRCPQALIFSGGTAALVGARFSLQCISQFAAGDDTPAASQ